MLDITQRFWFLWFLSSVPLTGLALSDVLLRLRGVRGDQSCFLELPQCLAGLVRLCKSCLSIPPGAFLDTGRCYDFLPVSAVRSPVGIGRKVIQSPPRQAYAQIFSHVAPSLAENLSSY